VLAFGLELVTFFIDFTEKLRILHGEHRLHSEGRDEIDRSLWKPPGISTADDQEADDLTPLRQRGC
jgi:hypothetical protein